MVKDSKNLLTFLSPNANTGLNVYPYRKQYAAKPVRFLIYTRSFVNVDNDAE